MNLRDREKFPKNEIKFDINIFEININMENINPS